MPPSHRHYEELELGIKVQELEIGRDCNREGEFLLATKCTTGLLSYFIGTEDFRNSKTARYILEEWMRTNLASIISSTLSMPSLFSILLITAMCFPSSPSRAFIECTSDAFLGNRPDHKLKGQLIFIQTLGKFKLKE